MGLFSPYKRKPDGFNYVPRYYDPEKERRDQRRRELCGQSAEDAGREYEPGQYIRTQREARAARRGERRGEGTMMSRLVLCGGIIVLVLFVYMLYPRIADAFAAAGRSGAAEQNAAVEEFDPYAPILVVPNDYKEE